MESLKVNECFVVAQVTQSNHLKAKTFKVIIIINIHYVHIPFNDEEGCVSAMNCFFRTSSSFLPTFLIFSSSYIPSRGLFGSTLLSHMWSLSLSLSL